MRTDAESLILEFLDERGGGKIGLVSGPWHDHPHERVALDLLGGLRGKIKHPGWLRIFDVSRSDCRWWATFEAVRGLDLLDWRNLCAGGFETAVSVSVIDQLAEFLSVVNPDWSHITRPEHVIIEETGQLRVAYFEAYSPGLGGPLIDLGRPPSDWHDVLPPELLENEEHNEAMMVYALGVLLTFLITGKRPLKKEDAHRTMMEARTRTTPISRVIELPRNLVSLLDAATVPNRGERIATLRELRLRLNPWLRDQGDILGLVRAAIARKDSLTDQRIRFCL